MNSPSFVDERRLRLWVRTPAGSPFSPVSDRASVFPPATHIYASAENRPSPHPSSLRFQSRLPPALLRSRYRRTRLPHTTECPRRQPCPRAQHCAGTRSVSATLPSITPPNHTPPRRAGPRPASHVGRGNSYVHTIPHAPHVFPDLRQCAEMRRGPTPLRDLR